MSDEGLTSIGGVEQTGSGEEQGQQGQQGQNHFPDPPQPSPFGKNDDYYKATNQGGQQYNQQYNQQNQQTQQQTQQYNQGFNQEGNQGYNQYTQKPPTPQPKNTDSKEGEGLTGLFNDSYPDEFANDKRSTNFFDVVRQQFPDLDLNRVMERAWQEQDSRLIDNGYLKEKLGDMAEPYAEFFSDFIDGYAEGMAEELNSWAEGVFQQFGGQHNWNRVVSVFNETADDGLKSHIKELLDSPDVDKRNIGVSMIKSVVQPSGALPQRGRQLGQGSVPAQGGQALSKQEFKNAIFKLQRSGNYTPEQVAELQHRRKLGIQQGL